MQDCKVKLVDKTRTVLATARVADASGQFSGTIDVSRLPPNVRALFDEFEEIVDGQMFSLLDQIHAKIESLSVRAVFDEGPEVAIKDLQIFPSTGDVSFRFAEIARELLPRQTL